MFYCAKICFICLEAKENLKEICPNREETEIYKRIQFVLPEIVLSDSGKTARVCSNCQMTLESYHTFKKMCLDNYNQWTHYVEQAKADQEKEPNSTTTSRKRKHADTESPASSQTIEEIFIKQEPETETLDIEEMEFEENEVKNEVIDVQSSVDSCEDSGSYKNTDSKEEDKNTDTTKEDDKQSSSNSDGINKPKLPDSSKKKYEMVYLRFMEWRQENKIETFTETDMMEYFNKLLADKRKYSTLMSVYSILRTTLLVHHDVDIGKNDKIYQFLKQQSKDYKPTKSEVFTPEQMNYFINNAPDEIYLLTKVVMIIGVTGALFRDDLRKITINDVMDINNTLTIQIRDTKLTITGQYYNVCKKYIDIRSLIFEQVFFLSYRMGKCNKQVVGINKFSSMPQEIATWLKLPNPKSYTGKCFRRTAATVGLDSKGNFIKMKRRWKKVLQSNYNTMDIENDDNDNDIESEEEIIPIEATDNNYDDVDSDVEEIMPFDVCSIETGAQQVQPTVTCQIMEANEIMEIKEEDKQSTSNNDVYIRTRLSEKSKQKYETTYSRFMDWRTENKIETFSEPDIMKYFDKLLADKFKCSTVVTMYSILRSTLLVKHNIDIAKYDLISKFIKQQTIDQKLTKTEVSVFTPEQILAFINFAPDEKYLLTKVAMIIGIIGAFRREEFRELSVNDIQDTNTSLIIKVRDIKFSVIGYFYSICKKYINLRPKTSEKSFFLNYQKGKCTKQVVGINKFSSFPRQIALYLRLPNPKTYTGKCFRRTAATVGLDSKGNFVKMQRRWKRVLQSSYQSDEESEEEGTPFETCSMNIKQEPTIIIE